MGLFQKAQQDFSNIPQEEQPKHLGDISGACMDEMLLYAYQHLNVFKLILCHSEGTRFSHLIDEMVEIEIKGTHDYLAVLEKLGRPAPPIDEHLEHVLITGMFNTFFELIIQVNNSGNTIPPTPISIIPCVLIFVTSQLIYGNGRRTYSLTLPPTSKATIE